MKNVVHAVALNKLQQWRKAAAMNGTKTEIARLSGVSRLTLDNVLKTGRARRVNLEKLDKAFTELGTLTIS